MAPSAKRLKTLDLFSGCLGLHIGVRARYRPVAFCEIDSGVRNVIAARMADGLVEQVPIFGDVKELAAEALPQGIEALVAGFPCTDISNVGSSASAETPP